MKVFFAADHAGFDLKNVLMRFAKDKGYSVEDCGAFELNKDDDYPQLVASAAKKISENPKNRAVLLGGSGQGEAIVANRFSNVRAVVYYGCRPDIIRLSREHNDANVLSLGARFLGEEESKDVLIDWLRRDSPTERRHQRRVAQIENIQETYEG
ncbi:ribose-5-phosphate isomerase [Candidatus Kaiserbacteria bacterium CG10_big_fil_rev_8_21_14_0_10_43_70]|uniref:Ribose-5-phosphate isomerase n=1 Tax=Candidatus Kaiserbacteria bacterium CG10_big_fil_rev_8_21_14_0_10_43_70 TaxID=1974605 RepID=A0A2H0UJD8_9BACT|nr:MAG: ribose-5-phosphate isomerase [Candidatus Kaiserbacteria bacterium CG10_big_fil_rev_8_21_14_0_10_43_70]